MYTHRHLGVEDHPAPVTDAPGAMTRDSVRRRGARPFGFPLPRDAVTTLVLIIIAGMLLRVLVGGVLLPLSGFRIDVGDFTAWAQRLGQAGPGEFYDPNYFSDYPPGYLYILWLLGTVANMLKPLVMGFGISTADHARMMNKLVDAFIVGSALVKAGKEGVEPVKALAHMLRQALD